MKKKGRYGFGWEGVRANYSVRDVRKDCFWPAIASSILVVIAWWASVDIFPLLEKVLSRGLTMLPSVLSLLVAGYAILLSVFLSSFGKDIRQYPKGKYLSKELNALFAGVIYVMVATLLFSLALETLVYVASEFFTVMPVWVNCVVTFLVFALMTMLFLSIKLLKDIAISTYDLGQLLFMFEDTDKTESGDEPQSQMPS
jgi:hypothetical protein